MSRPVHHSSVEAKRGTRGLRRVSCALDTLFSDDEVLAGSIETQVAGVTLDTRLLQTGDLYLALAGRTTHGLLHVESAINAGAAAVAAAASDWDQHPSMRRLVDKAGLVRVGLHGDPISRAVDIADKVYERPGSRVCLIAVTGTDGKTSVCRFISDALTAVGHRCGYIGTVGWGIGDALSENALTTPDVVMLRRLLFELAESGASHVAFEASSHALAEGRLAALEIRVAVLTNLGRDHLDYHGSLEAYREAKASLFRWPTLDAIVVNASDELGRSLLASVPDGVASWAFDSQNAGAESVVSDDVELVRASNIVSSNEGLGFNLHDDVACYAVDSRLVGRFNVDNLLACHAVLRASGIAANEAVHALAEVKPVAGRMELFKPQQANGPVAVVDFAHTPQSLTAAIAALRDHCAGNLWVVFGCGGDRDPGKRAPMAAAAAAGDCIVLTDDNPRTESSAAIISDAMKGFGPSDNYQIIADRAEAIRHALGHAAIDDVVLIAGKGHEDYQIIGNEKRAFSDREAVLAVFQEAS